MRTKFKPGDIVFCVSGNFTRNKFGIIVEFQKRTAGHYPRYLVDFGDYYGCIPRITEILVRPEESGLRAVSVQLNGTRIKP